MQFLESGISRWVGQNFLRLDSGLLLPSCFFHCPSQIPLIISSSFGCIETSFCYNTFYCLNLSCEYSIASLPPALLTLPKTRFLASCQHSGPSFGLIICLLFLLFLIFLGFLYWLLSFIVTNLKMRKKNSRVNNKVILLNFYVTPFLFFKNKKKCLM